MPAITIQSFDFETPDIADGTEQILVPTGWFAFGEAVETQIVDPTGGILSLDASSGEQYLGLGRAGGFGFGRVTIAQILTQTYDVDDDYTFSVDLSAGPTFGGGNGDFIIRVLAGDTVIGILDSTTVGVGNAPSGSFQTFQVSSTVKDASLNGQALRIEISTTANTATDTLFIDNVQGEFVVNPLADGRVDGEETGELMDTTYADSQGDEIDGSDGIDDTVLGNGGDDTIESGLGADVVDGGTGNDDIDAGDGDDTVYASAGSDTVDGGAGTDTYDASGTTEFGVDDEVLTVNVGTAGTNGSAGDFGDGTVLKNAEGVTDTVNNIEVFIADEDQPSAPTGTGLLPGSPTLPADDADTDYFNVSLDGSDVDANDVTGAPDGPDGKEAVFIAVDDGNLTDFKFRFSGGNDDETGGDGEEDIIFFDLSGFDDDFNIELVSENGTSFATQDKIIITNATSRVDNVDGTVTVEYIGSDGSPHTVVIDPDNNVEVLVYGDPAAGVGQTDVINLSNAVFSADVQGLSDAAVGTFTPAGGGGPIAFGGGGGQPVLSDLLNNTAEGDWVITSGDESGTVGGIEFANFETITFSTVAGDPNGPPDAVDDVETTLEDTPIDIAVLANDSDPDGDPISVDSFTQPTNGTVVVGPGGTLTYTPDPGYTGPDSFTYTITDSNGNFDTATVTLDVTCFVRGTQIATQDGPKNIEDIEVGEMVQTMDHGFQAVRWIESTKIPGTGRNAPVLIRKGALGNERDLMVSPQHRMLLQGWRLELLFSANEALVPAKRLINDATIVSVELEEVEYFHMMFDQHEIVFAEGAPSESFHPGELGMGALSEGTREEIYRLFPALRDDLAEYGPSCRGSLTSHEASILKDTL